METLKFSFIVPVYNVAQYLRKCVDSLLAQDYYNYEIILVDDGSTDNSPQICDEYASRSFVNSFTHSLVTVRVIHQANAGLSAARNAGIKCAKGEYICFVDSDDYWEPNVLGSLMAQIERDSLDVLRYRFQYVDSQYQVFSPFSVNPFRGNNYSKEPMDGVTFLNTSMNTQCYAVMYIVRREIIPLFTEGIHFEDVDWTPRMLLNASKVASIPTVIYNYLIREGSITQDTDNIEKKKRNVEDTLHVISRLNQLIVKHPDCIWLQKMRSDLSIAVLDSIAKYLYTQRSEYICQLRNLGVFPLVAPYGEMSLQCKVILYNLSSQLMIGLMRLYIRTQHK